MKTRLKSLLASSVLLSGGLAFAEPPPPPPDSDMPPPPMDEPRPPQHEHGMRGNRDERAPAMMMERMIEQLAKDNPEEQKALLELRKTDPQAFREKVRELMKQRMAKQGNRAPQGMERMRKVMELARTYHEAPEGDVKEKAKADLAVAVKDAFDQQLATQEERLNDLEDKVTRAKAELEINKSKRDELIQKRLDLLLAAPLPGQALREFGERPVGKNRRPAKDGAPPPPPDGAPPPPTGAS